MGGGRAGRVESSDGSSGSSEVAEPAAAEETSIADPEELSSLEIIKDLQEDESIPEEADELLALIENMVDGPSKTVFLQILVLTYGEPSTDNGETTITLGDHKFEAEVVLSMRESVVAAIQSTSETGFIDQLTNLLSAMTLNTEEDAVVFEQLKILGSLFANMPDSLLSDLGFEIEDINNLRTSLTLLNSSDLGERASGALEVVNMLQKAFNHEDLSSEVLDDNGYHVADVKELTEGGDLLGNLDTIHYALKYYNDFQNANVDDFDLSLASNLQGQGVPVVENFMKFAPVLEALGLIGNVGDTSTNFNLNPVSVPNPDPDAEDDEVLIVDKVAIDEMAQDLPPEHQDAFIGFMLLTQTAQSGSVDGWPTLTPRQQHLLDQAQILLNNGFPDQAMALIAQVGTDLLGDVETMVLSGEIDANNLPDFYDQTFSQELYAYFDDQLDSSPPEPEPEPESEWQWQPTPGAPSSGAPADGEGYALDDPGVSFSKKLAPDGGNLLTEANQAVFAILDHAGKAGGLAELTDANYETLAYARELRNRGYPEAAAMLEHSVAVDILNRSGESLDASWEVDDAFGQGTILPIGGGQFKKNDDNEYEVKEEVRDAGVSELYHMVQNNPSLVRFGVGVLFSASDQLGVEFTGSDKIDLHDLQTSYEYYKSVGDTDNADRVLAEINSLGLRAIGKMAVSANVEGVSEEVVNVNFYENYRSQAQNLVNTHGKHTLLMMNYHLTLKLTDSSRSGSIHATEEIQLMIQILKEVMTAYDRAMNAALG